MAHQPTSQLNQWFNRPILPGWDTGNDAVNKFHHQLNFVVVCEIGHKPFS